MTAEQSLSTGAAEVEQAAPADPDTYRILLVEDDPGDALLVRELLADTGLAHTLRWTLSLGEALAEARREPPDCILLDLHLPDAAGMKGVRALQQDSPMAGVIVLTGLAESEAGVAAVAHGAQDYLVKGQVDGDLLRRALRYSVHRKRAERSASELRENRLRAAENARLERGLLPAPLLTGDRVRVAARYLPGRDLALLGGDFLDVVQTPDGVVHAVIGDVSGHGPDEAALGVCLRISWRALVLAGHRDADVLTNLERILVAERAQPDAFATCGTVTVDLDARRATVLLAGHHEPLLIEGLDAGPVMAKYGAALGIKPGRCTWVPTEVELPDAGAFVLYTDGLIEGHAGPGSERVGPDGLLGLIAGAPRSSPNALLDHLVSTVRELDAGRHEDDLAILHLAWDESGVVER